MAQCKWCGRSGFFLSVSSNELCGNCNPSFILEVSQRLRIITESLALIKSSKNLATRLSRCDLVISNATPLIRYEERGISTLNPPPSHIVSEHKQKRDELVASGLRSEIEGELARVEILASPASKITRLTKALLLVDSMAEQTSDKALLDTLRSHLHVVRASVQLQKWIQAAEKAEFKGNTKRALDQYYEALYFLRHDEVPDELQKAQSSTIESKIQQLGGQVPA